MAYYTQHCVIHYWRSWLTNVLMTVYNIDHRYWCYSAFQKEISKVQILETLKTVQIDCYRKRTILKPNLARTMLTKVKIL